MVREPSPRRRSPIDVFRYLDYRAFLADFYAAKKRKGFSYRAFSRAAGLGAPNYLKLVISGQRNLTPPMAARFAAACGLAGDAAEYFQQLVEFNQADTLERRNAGYARITAFDRYRRGHKLELAQAAYHSTWYLPAIRELVGSPLFDEDPEQLATLLWPPIKPTEAETALTTLLELGLIERDPHGRLRQTSAVVSTGPETFGMHITNYHAEMMRRATSAMELVPAAQRDISSLTFCVGKPGSRS
ncbi:MAG TPA: TIGR02147 family protein [Polyangiales bacterium]|nr:TIGR02147 family protein [Polyangiales bacterium]